MSYLPPAPQFLAFVGVAGLLTVTPGADMALVMRRVLASGRRHAFFTSLGIGLGCLVHGTASALGLAVVLARSAAAFAVLKYAGAGYLIFLGVQALKEAITTKDTAGSKDTKKDQRVPVRDLRDLRDRRGFRDTPTPRACFVQGLLTNLLNPKVAIFYLTFLPQFVSPARPILSQSVVLAATHVAMGLVWLTIYARFVDRLAGVVTSGAVKRRIEAVTGAVLIGLGVRLALASRD